MTRFSQKSEISDATRSFVTEEKDHDSPFSLADLAPGQKATVSSLQLDGLLYRRLLDEARRKGIVVDTDRLSEQLGVPVVGATARRGQGLGSLRKTVYGIACGDIEAHPVTLRYDSVLERALDELVPAVKAALPEVPNPRWIALRLLDGGDTRLNEAIRDGSSLHRERCHG